MSESSPATPRRKTDSSGRSPRTFGLFLAAVLCVAALLRIYRLDAQSLWHDEGNSARIAERSLDLIVEGAAGDIHPPGYYLLLHAWRGVFGQSEFALRSLSVAGGLLMVLFTGLLGRWLFGPTAGLMAASLSAFSPFAIYYSQEARMYALLGALSAASSYVAFRTWGELVDGSRVRIRQGTGVVYLLWPAAYALVNAVGLYTHYAFLFVLVAHNAAFGIRWLVAWVRSGPRWRSLTTWAGANLGAMLLYLPWLPTALDAAGWSSAGGEYELGAALLGVGHVLTVGVTQSPGEASVAVAGALVLLVSGLFSSVHAYANESRESASPWATRSLALYILVPLGLFFGFDLYKPAWLKFLIILLPPFHVLMAQGISRVATLFAHAPGLAPHRRGMVVAVVCGVFLVALGLLTYPSLHNLYFNPAYARDDYRQLATDIRAMRRSGDAIVLNAPNQWEVFTYYHPDRDVYPAPYRPRPGRASAFLDPLLDEYERIFVLYWGDAESDPEKRIESWLAQHAYKAGDRWYGDVRLATYRVAPLPQEPDVVLDAMLGPRVLLQGYALAEDRVAPGGIVPVTLFWEALDAVEEPRKVSVQMLNRNGQLVSQIDTVPGDGLAPMTSWEAGMSLVDRYGLPVPAQAPPGRYSLIVAIYDAGSGEREPVVVDGERRGDHVSLGDVTVRPDDGEA